VTSHIKGFDGAPPKPGKRGPKARKPIARSRERIKTNVLPAKVRKSDAGKAKHSADRVWSAAVLASRTTCAAIGFGRHQRCEGPHDPAHIVRRAFLATRHLPENGIRICRKAHDYYGRHPVRWKAFVIRRIGRDAYARLVAIAHQGKRVA
jgi:hypothetical protein